MNATRTVLIIKQQVFESAEDIIIFYIFYIIIAISYVFFISLRGIMHFIIFEIIGKISLVYSMVLQNNLLDIARNY